MRYIELDPVRAGMVNTPEEYRWSSHGTNAWGDENKYLSHHDLYNRLGSASETRQAAYRELFKGQLDDATLLNIRSACHTGTPLGNERFKEYIEAKLGCSVGQDRRGRPGNEI